MKYVVKHSVLVLTVGDRDVDSFSYQSDWLFAFERRRDVDPVRSVGILSHTLFSVVPTTSHLWDLFVHVVKDNTHSTPQFRVIDVNHLSTHATARQTCKLQVLLTCNETRSELLDKGSCSKVGRSHSLSHRAKAWNIPTLDFLLFGVRGNRSTRRYWSHINRCWFRLGLGLGLDNSFYFNFFLFFNLSNSLGNLNLYGIGHNIILSFGLGRYRASTCHKWV
jgi:hypothetical protein